MIWAKHMIERLKEVMLRLGFNENRVKKVIVCVESVSYRIKQKYFRNGDLLSYKPKTTDSVVWKSICGVLEIFK